MSREPLADTLAADSATTADRLVVGERYQLLGLLGAGGMGNVYRARDLELDELVALKVLKPELIGTPGTLDRFRREVKLARRVTHPNVARVFDIGERGGDKILTMELVDGESLSSLLEREGALPVGRAIEIASAIAAGVGAAHAAGVVHRDLKPDNVMLARDGRVVVTDFGIARAARGDGAKTAGGFVGTPAYMAPEQIEEGAPIDERADLYAFGAMLYELVVGEHAWQGESVFAIAAARLLKPPPDPRARRPDLPPSFAAVVLRCMARQPADRYASMAEVAGALAGLTLPLAGVGSPAPAPSVRTDDGLDVRGGKRVAVLPFDNLGPPEQQYVADGLTEDLIDVLTMSSGLRVSSRGVVMRYKGGGLDAREVGRELGVAAVVEGSVRRAPGGFRIAARVVSVADGFQLWARRFDAADADLLARNDEIARAVAEALSVDLARAERARADDPGVVDLYLRARDAYHRGFRDDMAGAVGLFGEALGRSPDDPRLLAGYALAQARRAFLDPPGLASTRNAAARAIELAPWLPDGHVAAGVIAHFQLGDAAGAVRPLRRALRLAPTHGGAHDVLGTLLYEGQHDDVARRHLETAIALEPHNDLARLNLSTMLALLGDWDAASAVIDGASEGTRLAVLVRVAMWRGDPKAAAELLPSCDRISPHHAVLSRAMLELAISGTPLYDALPAFPPGMRVAHLVRNFFLQTEVECAATVGDRSRALEVLARADAEGLGFLCWLDRCPMLEPIRREPAFAEVRRHTAERAAAVLRELDAPEG